MNRKSSQYSGKTKNSSLASCLSMQSIYSKNSSPHLHSVSSYNILSPDQTIQDLKKEISNKDIIISKLENRIEHLLASDRSRNTQNPEYLHKLIKKGDNKLEELKQQIGTINKENEALLNKQKELISIIAKYRKENSELKQAISTRKGGDFNDLESKLVEIENLQIQLMSENAELKTEILNISNKSDEMLDLKLSVLGNELFKAKIDVEQILKVLNIIKAGKELDLNLLLQHQFKDEDILGSNYKQCTTLVLKLRKDIEEVKDIIADMKAEYYGSHCITQ